MISNNATEQSSNLTPTGISVDGNQIPEIADLMARLHFAPGDGRIWLDDQRMQLIHTSAMGTLRRELIEGLGIGKARGLLTRMGYNSGARDAHLARKLRPGASLQDMFAVGPQLHALEGIVLVEPVSLDIDTEQGRYRGEYIWRESSEDEEHIRIYGIGAEPVCWTQIGYASGYTSVFMGRPVLFREIECRATGGEHCRIVGKPIDDWEDAEQDASYLKAESFSSGLTAVRSAAKLSIDERTAAMFGDTEIVGVSTGFNAVCHMIRSVADTDATVLFLGESGVGKEVFARTLHRTSTRANESFVAVNCAAIPEALVESELFGIEKGAFTGANASRSGRFERAHKGTLFLDEIGILSLTAQGKLLRALQEGEIERVGDTKTRKVDVRVVAATNLDLRAEITKGNFREDLFFRLNVFPVKVPPLRERLEDIPILMNHFIKKYSNKHRRHVSGFTARAIDALLSYELPGNIRELENLIERGVILVNNGSAIDTTHIFVGDEKWNKEMCALQTDRHDSGPMQTNGRSTAESARTTHLFSRKIDDLLLSMGADGAGSLDVVEATIRDALLDKAILRANGNVSAAARMLGITRARLNYRMTQKRAALAPRTR